MSLTKFLLEVVATLLFASFFIFLGFGAGREVGFKEMSQEMNDKLQNCQKVIYDGP